MKPVIVWVLLVDKMHARILETQGPQAGLVQLPGRVYGAPRPLYCSYVEGHAPVGHTGARVRLNKRFEHTPESIEFVHSILDILRAAHRQGEFDHLVVCAAPSMLGLIHQYLPEELHKNLKHELARDLVQVPMKDMPAHLPVFYGGESENAADSAYD